MPLKIEDLADLVLSNNELLKQQLVRFDDTNANLIFMGVARAGTLDSAPAWRIVRITRAGAIYTLETAAGGLFNQIWNNRAAIFVTPVLTNTKSILFDGVNDYLSLGNNYSFEVSQAFSWSFWVKPQNVAAQRCMIAKTTTDASVYGYSIQHDATGNLLVQMRSTGTLANAHTFTDTTLTASVWQHVVLTYSGASNLNGLRAYKNGVVSAVNSISVPMVGTIVHTEFLMMARRGNTLHFSGNLDEVSVWDKALSQSDVTALYNGGTAGDLNNHVAYANLRSWWRNGDVDTYPTITDNKDSVTGTMTNMVSSAIVTDAP